MWSENKKRDTIQRPAKLPVGRCIHVGASTGPHTEAGLARVAAANTKHGRHTKIEKAKAKARAQREREIWKELKEIENWCIEHGHLKKNWRKDFIFK